VNEKLNILIYNSDRPGLEVTKGSLNYMGFENVAGVTNDKSVLNRLKEKTFEVLLADYTTIVEHSEGMLKTLRDYSKIHAVRVVLLIRDEIGVEELKRMYREGVSAVLKYPFQMNDVQKAIDDAVRSEPMAVSKTLAKIKELDFFSFLDNNELLALLKMARCRRYQTDDIIFDEGAPGDRLYVVVDGIVAIAKVIGKREAVLAKLKRGTCFGEMALIDGSPRSARARAYDDSILLELDRRIMEGYDDIITLKLFKKMAYIFSKRIRQADTKIRELSLHANIKKKDSQKPD
jgi:CRP-like cAMP-binding protein